MMFFVCLFVGLFGALSNTSIKTIGQALIIGGIFGAFFGLIMAYVTRED